MFLNHSKSFVESAYNMMSIDSKLWRYILYTWKMLPSRGEYKYFCIKK